MRHGTNYFMGWLHLIEYLPTRNSSHGFHSAFSLAKSLHHTDLICNFSFIPQQKTFPLKSTTSSRGTIHVRVQSFPHGNSANMTISTCNHSQCSVHTKKVELYIRRTIIPISHIGVYLKDVVPIGSEPSHIVCLCHSSLSGPYKLVTWNHGTSRQVYFSTAQYNQ